MVAALRPRDLNVCNRRVESTVQPFEASAGPVCADINRWRNEKSAMLQGIG